jgi:predicted alpha-1,6-mannanase (GH76 family)
VNPKGFLNSFYDDEGWWALGWIKAYDVTGNTEYLNTAVDIFTDMNNGSSTRCSSNEGGIWWDKANTYVNAIANELYLSVAAHLANRVTSLKSFYLKIAEDQWTWFQNSGMINSKSLINDGLTTACKNNNGTVWSYNQGVILGALVELNTASPNNSYLSIAHSIANAAIIALSTNGILHDPCEPNCGADGGQFKGIFMRNLQILQTASPDPNYLSFIKANAGSIWASDRNVTTNELSVDWAGPFVGVANASTQSSALDALVAAVAFNGVGLGR